MKTFDKLKARIKKDLGVDLTDFKRTYAGIHQRSAGAFVWTAEDIENKLTYGSTETATSLITKSEKIERVEPRYGLFSGNVEVC